jgi:hypothetical protein
LFACTVDDLLDDDLGMPMLLQTRELYLATLQRSPSRPAEAEQRSIPKSVLVAQNNLETRDFVRRLRKQAKEWIDWADNIESRLSSPEGFVENPHGQSGPPAVRKPRRRAGIE